MQGRAGRPRRGGCERFDAALGARTAELALVARPDGTLASVSPAVAQVLGHDPARVEGCSGYDFVHPDDVVIARTAFERVVRTGGTATFTVRVRSADDRWRWVEETCTDLRGTDVGGVACHLRDVTERVEAEVALRAAEARYRTLLDTADEAVWVLSGDGRTLDANARTAELLGVAPETLHGRSWEDLLGGDVRGLGGTADGDAHGDDTGDVTGPRRSEVLYAHPDGTDRVLLVSTSPLPGPGTGEGRAGAPAGTLAMVSDVTAARRAERALRRAAVLDQLTGLPNRSLMLDRLEGALADEPRRTAVLFVDLDDFGDVNDTRGHAVGDRVLQQVASRLVRARPGGLVARHGGDEFVVLLDDTDEAAARDAATRLIAALEPGVEVDGHRLHVRASIGIATGAHAADAAELLRYADLAMYAAKASGRPVEVFDPAMAAEVERRHALAEDLRVALADDALRVEHQPVLDLATGRTTAVEALARWTHPRLGTVRPDQFVAVAEATGLAPALDRWVLRRALDDLARLRALGHDLRMAVNLSARTVAEPGLEADVVAAAVAAGVPADRVVLEVTESAFLRDLPAAAATLGALRARGFGVALDDFGTGFSSLSYLRDLPISVLKVDRSFVTDLVAEDGTEPIVAAVLQLAAAVHATVVAEGVETPEQAQVLRRLGCPRGQGWLWSAALPLDALVAHLGGSAPTPS